MGWAEVGTYSIPLIGLTCMCGMGGGGGGDRSLIGGTIGFTGTLRQGQVIKYFIAGQVLFVKKKCIFFSRINKDIYHWLKKIQ